MPSKPSDIANANLDELVEKLTTQEAIGLVAGVGWWHTHAVPRLGIPAIKVSDGPNGVRGGHFLMGSRAKALPCATALGATWDVELIREATGRLLAEEAKLRAASVILAPTVNIQRSPLGGRSFESFSEDPHLSGHIASSYISGVQARGIGCCIKHFVANDMENDRQAYSSVVSDRALREIYLMPFMIAEKTSQPWSYMTAYNRVNGLHVSENPFFLKDVLRKEWGSKALVMSDWWGIYGVSEAINAGCDLEMPGELKWRTPDTMSSALKSKKITLRTVKERAKKVVELVQKCAEKAPEVVDGDGIERTRDSKEDVEMMRSLAAASIVLLKNDKAILPLSLKGSNKIAVIGPNAKAKLVSGGGSAALKASYFVTPYDGIVNAVRDAKSKIELTYHQGAEAGVSLPTLEDEVITSNKEPGFSANWYSHSDDKFTIIEKPVKVEVIDETRMFFGDSSPEGLSERWSLHLKGFLKPRGQNVDYEFSLEVDGRAKLFVDGKLIIDNWGKQPKSEGRHGEVELRGTVPLTKGKSHEVSVEFSNVRGEVNSEAGAINRVGPYLRIGGKEVIDADKAMDESVEIAKAADIVILVIGLNGDWESEGYDRTTLGLPQRTNELVERILAANGNTVIVTQSGSAIEMPWLHSVPALLHAWYLGNATGDALADVLFGKVNPSGKLSLTFPKRLEDTPSYGHFASQNGEVRYAEDVFVGYKHYQNIDLEPLFPFGYGLSYTNFSFSDLKILGATKIVNANDFVAMVSVTVTNTGSAIGSETVQVYVSLPESPWGHLHPPSQLKGFAKVKDLKAGERRDIQVKLDKYAISYWETGIGRWRAEKGKYVVGVGSSSADIKLRASFEIAHTLEWTGL